MTDMIGLMARSLKIFSDYFLFPKRTLTDLDFKVALINIMESVSQSLKTQHPNHRM